jgi:hypothetical protein
MPDSSEPSRVSRYFARPGFWIAAVLIVVFAAFAVPTGGVGGFLIMLAFGCLLTGLYSFITGRGSWAAIPSRRVAALVIVLAVVVGVLGGALVPSGERRVHPAARGAFAASGQGSPASLTVAATADSSATETTALALLATLPVKGKAPMTGYARTVMFGAAWVDQDRNGCDTRNDILSRDLVRVAKSGGCRVLSGVLVSPYTGKTVDFVRGSRTSTAVQIDHVVSRGDAWRTGAQQLKQAQRVALANDPINLFAVDGRSNEQKSDGDTATWLPAAKSFRCEYVSHQVSVKVAYRLWVTVAEHAAMLRVLSTCPAENAVSSPVASAPAAPAPLPPASVPPAPAGVVHPGAFCSTAGATGQTAKGSAMRCTTTTTDARLRWRAA